MSILSDAGMSRCPAALFFVFGCATSAAQVALLSMLAFYSLRFGPQVFVALNLATYLPSLPIVLLQGRLDSTYDRIFSTAVAFRFRVAVSLLVLAATLCALPLLPLHGEWELLVCAAVIGIFTGVVFGSFYQLLTFFRAEEQTSNTAAFAFGYQGVGVVVLLLSILAFRGHAEDPTPAMVDQFFFSVALVPLGAFVLFIALTATEAFRASARARDGTDAASASEPLLSEQNFTRAEQGSSEPFESDQAFTRLGSLGMEHVGSLGGAWVSVEKHDSEDAGLSLSQAQCLKRCLPCAACIFVTIFASVVVFPFYTYVPSSNPAFPTILFYTKIFSDTISRPLTTKLQCVSSPKYLLVAAIVRLGVCVPAFFMYITGLVPQNDAVFCGSIAVFSFFSGYLTTSAFQAAPSTVPPEYRSRVATVCAVSFQVAFAAALLLALGVRPLVFPGP
eukprot:Tamp_16226.p1 GENE.Tamp_16226~~Tamp_16226.p1  ORF type:complete len:447 (+),score=61.96 Tamp_16226:115-1455(+)